jgi:HPt (histidine-containing phosphotransfer) domain-containing protein
MAAADLPLPQPAAGDAGAGFEAAFAALRRRFVAGLPARWLEIERAPSVAARQAALHRLAGAAGSYGYAALGAAARRAEVLLAAGDEAALAAALRDLKAALEADCATLR